MMTEGNILSEMLIIKEVMKESVSVNFYAFLDILALGNKNYINL